MNRHIGTTAAVAALAVCVVCAAVVALPAPAGQTDRATSGKGVPMQVAKWTVFEADFQAAADCHYENPFWDVTVQVQFTSPAGRTRTVEAFWDGGRTWRARFCPDQIGQWSWRSQCAGKADSGLHDRAGQFECIAYNGDNPLSQHGPIRLSEDRRRFIHADGTDFFFLSDTAWNGVLRARGDDWQRYLRTRREQLFTAVQFVCTHWRGHTKDSLGQTAFEGTDRVRLNPAFFQRMDGKVAAINAHGLLAVPVVLWTLTPKDPGQILSEADAIRVARYIVARWGAHHVIWLLGGDGDYRGAKAERWRRVGRAVFIPRDRLVSMHPCGRTTFAPELREEPWLDFLSYQSGHGDAPDHVRWTTSGPMSTDWQGRPTMPVVNLEPNYEGHMSYNSKKPHSDQHVRRAAWWSLLIAPPAGVSYGCNPIWVWPDKPEAAEGHPNINAAGLTPPWHEGLRLPGIEGMTILRRFMEAVGWMQLQPAQELLGEQPGSGEKGPERFIAAARRQDDSLAVFYLPVGGSIAVKAGLLKGASAAAWFNPRTGQWADAGAVATPQQAFAAPDGNDWVLCIGTREAVEKARR